MGSPDIIMEHFSQRDPESAKRKREEVGGVFDKIEANALEFNGPATKRYKYIKSSTPLSNVLEYFDNDSVSVKILDNGEPAIRVLDLYPLNISLEGLFCTQRFEQTSPDGKVYYRHRIGFLNNNILITLKRVVDRLTQVVTNYLNSKEALKDREIAQMFSTDSTALEAGTGTYAVKLTSVAFDNSDIAEEFQEDHEVFGRGVVCLKFDKFKIDPEVVHISPIITSMSGEVVELSNL